MNDKLLLFVAGYDAVISTYEVNTNDGGECSHIGSQYLLASVSVKEQSAANNLAQDTNCKFILNDPISKLILSFLLLDELVGVYPPNLVRNDNETILNSSASANDDES